MTTKKNNFNNVELFDGLSLDNLFKQIYNNSKNKSKKINSYINQIITILESNPTSDAALLLTPLISNYIESGIKNDDMLIKLAAIVQRTIQKPEVEESSENLLTQKEKEDLLNGYNSTAGKSIKMI